MTTKQVLIELRELLSDPACWTQSKFAVDAAGVAVAPGAPQAVRWCLKGGLDAIESRHRADLNIDQVKGARSAAWHQLWQTIEQHHGDIGIVAFNDRPGRTHVEILALIDDAIVAADAAQEDRKE